jgi:hypothetical protein
MSNIASPGALRQKGIQLMGVASCTRTAVPTRKEALSVPATDNDDDDKKACWSNRAEIHLRHELWESAEAEARTVLPIDPDHAKARYVPIGQGEVRLNQIDEQQIITELARDRVIKKKSLKAEARRLLRESQKGSMMPSRCTGNSDRDRCALRRLCFQGRPG